MERGAAASGAGLLSAAPESVREYVVGHEEAVEQPLVGRLTSRHVLLEGLPGL
jgi:MoxR-like ATPase